jgi:hypothetical protein
MEVRSVTARPACRVCVDSWMFCHWVTSLLWTPLNILAHQYECDSHFKGFKFKSRFSHFPVSVACIWTLLDPKLLTFWSASATSLAAGKDMRLCKLDKGSVNLEGCEEKSWALVLAISIEVLGEPNCLLPLHIFASLESSKMQFWACDWRWKTVLWEGVYFHSRLSYTLEK